MIDTFSKTPSARRIQPMGWTRRLPDGAVSVTETGNGLTLHASEPLQARFEELLERKKAGTLNQDEPEEYESLCSLDDALSWLNRLVRADEGQ